MMNYQEYENQWVEFPKLNKVSRTPLSLDIEITNRCNLQCSHCPFHKPDPLFKRKEMDMDFEMYTKIIDEISSKDTNSIKFNFGGEPTIYPNLVEAVQYAKDKGIFEIIINTNAVELTSHLGKALCDVGLTKLIVSDYNIFRQVKNVKAFNLIRDDCKLIINKVDCSEKWDMIDYDQLIASKFYDFGKLKSDTIESNFQCSYPWQRFIVLADGSIMSCSCGSLDYSKKIGHFPQDSIEETWLGSSMNELRRLHKDHESHKISYCQKCHLRKEYLIKKVLGLYEI